MRDFAYDAATDPTAAPGTRRCAPQVPSTTQGRGLPSPPPPATPARSRPRAPTSSGATAPPQRRRGLPGAGARLPRDRALPQGDAQTARSGSSRCSPRRRTGTGCGDSGCGAGEGQRRGAADRGGTEPEALAESVGLGSPPVPGRSRRSRPSSPPVQFGPRTMTVTRYPDQLAGIPGTASRLAFSTRRVVLEDMPPGFSLMRRSRSERSASSSIPVLPSLFPDRHVFATGIHSQSRTRPGQRFQRSTEASLRAIAANWPSSPALPQERESKDWL